MTEPTVPDTPILGNIDGIDLVDAGTWRASTGPFVPTPSDLANAVGAMDCPAVHNPALKLGHTGEQGKGEPAIGYAKNLRLSDEGTTIFCDFRGMPGWLTQADNDGNSVLASSYPKRSVETWHNYPCALGHVHPFVITAVAWLGVENPAVGTLDALYDLYTQAPSATAAQEAPMPTPTSAQATTDDVRRQYYEQPSVAGNFNLWICEMYVDPPQLIVSDDSTGDTLRVDYAVNGDGTVTFKDPVKVQVQYVAAALGVNDPAPVVHGHRPDRVYASRDESRPGQASHSTEGTGMADRPALLAALGLAEDASDVELDAAIAAARGMTATAPAAPVAPAAPAAPVAPVVPEGLVLVDAATLEELRTNASLGRDAATTLRTRDRDAQLSAAVMAGKISPARKEHWHTKYAADFDGATAELASIQPGLIPVTAPGSIAGVDEDEQALRDMDRLHSRPALQEA